MTRRKSWESIALLSALLVLAGIAGFGLYGTATSDLAPPVWSSADQSLHCWPAINWESAEGSSTGAGGMTADEAAAAIDAGKILDLIRGGPSQGAPSLQVVSDYFISLRQNNFSARPEDGPQATWDSRSKDLRALEAVHALLLADILSRSELDPDGALLDLQRTVQATYDAATRCVEPGTAMLWVLNLRRSLDVARVACDSTLNKDDQTAASQRNLAGWASDRKMLYEQGLDSMFIADYHQTRQVLSALVRKSRWWMFTWLPYDVQQIATEVDRCYVERFNLGIGTLWSARNATSWQPSPRNLGRKAHDLARSLCEHSTDTWEAVLTLHKAAPAIDSRLELLRECVNAQE